MMPRILQRRSPQGRRRPHRGFTLIELMLSLSLLGVLACIAMVGIAKYVQHTRTAEAISSVEAIAKGAADYYEKSDLTQPAGSRPDAVRAMRHFPPPSQASVPADLKDVQGKRYKSNLSDWSGSPWREIHFSLPQPQSYAYSFESEGAGPGARAVAVARGDLDGDDVWSSYRLSVKADETATPQVASAVEKKNPEE